MIPGVPSSAGVIHGASAGPRRMKLVHSSSFGVSGSLIRRSPMLSTSAACSSGWNIARIGSSVSSWARNSNSVTTPKLPPPPRSAQNRSACSSCVARTIRPSARTTVAVGERVDREPEAAHEPADAAAEREAADAGVRDDAGGDDEAVRLGAAVDVTEERAAPDPDAPCVPGRR